MAASDRIHAPGAALLGTIPLLSVGVLVLNDHGLKFWFPSVLTGKISDFAGLIFFPLLLRSFGELFAHASGSRRLQAAAVSLRVTGVCCVVTAAVFVLVKTWYPASEAYRDGLGAIRSALRSLFDAGASFRRASLTADWTDLIALPSTYLSYWCAERRLS
jgi:hypothetical protein